MDVFVAVALDESVAVDVEGRVSECPTVFGLPMIFWSSRDLGSLMV